MRTPFAYAVCVLMASPGPAAARGTQNAKKTKPAASVEASAEQVEKTGEAERAAENALLSWIAALADEQLANAKQNRLFLATTDEEKAACLEIEKAAEKQGNAAREMILANARYQQAAARAARDFSYEAFTAALAKAENAERESGAPTTNSLHSAASIAFERWKEAQEEAERLQASLEQALASLGDDANDRRSAGRPDPKAGVSPAPAPQSMSWNSWWCATNVFNKADQVCRMTKEACEAMGNSTLHYHDCWEQTVVSVVSFTQINGGRHFMAFPLLSQCERRRKALMKNKIDYREFSRCQSSTSFSP
jgi:hypothetical protein